MPPLASDFRQAGRALLRTPGFTVAVLLTLALGIGSATALYSVVYSVLLRPLPYPEPDRLVALMLSAVGMYSVVSYITAGSRRELGICMAVGAQAGQIVRLVLRRGLAPSVLGCAVGLVANAGIGAVVASHLYGVTGLDPVTVAGSTLIVLLTSLVACGVPAIRAARVSPLVALRAE